MSRPENNMRETIGELADRLKRDGPSLPVGEFIATYVGAYDIDAGRWNHRGGEEDRAATGGDRS